MTKKPEKKPDENNPTHFLPNKASAKAGLAKKILSSAWGLIAKFIEYKAQHAGKVFISVPPQFSSQECAISECGHIHPDNRQTQSEFVCQLCGHAENADLNAAKVIRKRGIEQLLQEVKVTHGTWESARGGTRKTRKAQKPAVQVLRSENRRKRRDGAELIPRSSVL